MDSRTACLISRAEDRTIGVPALDPLNRLYSIRRITRIDPGRMPAMKSLSTLVLEMTP